MPRHSALQTVIASVESEISMLEQKAAAARSLLDQLRSRDAGAEKTARKTRRRRRRRNEIERPARKRRARDVEKPAPTPKASPDGSLLTVSSDGASSDTTASRKARGAEQFAVELRRIAEIKTAIEKAEADLFAANRVRDREAGLAAKDVIKNLRREGGEILRKLRGRADLPLSKVEVRRWYRAASGVGAWHTDEHGNRTRVITADETLGDVEPDAGDEIAVAVPPAWPEANEALKQRYSAAPKAATT
jgi:hypothetical protein